MYWKGNEKREREERKKAQKEANEKARKEEELQEAKRQQRKLNFLITQTELYSHFVDKKIKTSEAEESNDTAVDKAIASDKPSRDESEDEDDNNNESAQLDSTIDFDVDDDAKMRQLARRNAQNAVNMAKQRASAFDQASAQEQARLAKEAGESASRLSGPVDCNLNSISVCLYISFFITNFTFLFHSQWIQMK